MFLQTVCRVGVPKLNLVMLRLWVVLLALLVEAPFGGERGHWVVVAEVDFVFVSDYGVEVSGQHVSQTCSHHNHVVLLQVGGSGFAFFAETKGVGVSGEQLLSSDLTHREHKNQLI